MSGGGKSGGSGLFGRITGGLGRGEGGQPADHAHGSVAAEPGGPESHGGGAGHLGASLQDEEEIDTLRDLLLRPDRARFDQLQLAIRDQEERLRRERARLDEQQRELDSLRRELNEAREAAQLSQTQLARRADELEALLDRTAVSHRETLDAHERSLLDQESLLADALQAQAEGFERQQRELSGHRALLERQQTALETDEFEERIAQRLAGAVRKADLVNDGRFRQALAPAMVDTVHTEIANSREKMVDALHPIMGRLVTASVRTQFAKLLESINERLEALSSGRRWRLWMQSKLTGKSEAELALADSAGPRIDRVMLVRRGAGTLLGHAEDPAALERASGRSDDMVAAMLSALTDFSSEAFEDGAASAGLRSIDLADRTVFVRASPHTLLAAQVSGPASQSFEEAVDEAFYRALEARREGIKQGPEADAAAQEVLAALQALSGPVQAGSPHKGPGPALWLLGFLGLLALGWIAWAVWDEWDDARQVAVVERVLLEHADVKGSTLRVREAADDHGVEASALLTTTALDPALEEAVRAATRRPVALWLDPWETPAPQIERVLERVVETPAPPPALPEPSPVERLSALIDGRAIYFDEATDYLYPGDSVAFLDRLAEHMQAAPEARLVVFGHADSLGGALTIAQTSQRRADVVRDALIARGAAPERITAIGRGDRDLIANDAGEASPNRRVEFMLAPKPGTAAP